jgi:hypothetical protein
MNRKGARRFGPASKFVETDGFLFGKPIYIEPGDHDAVTDADETPADLVLISPKFEGLARRF